MNKITLTFVSAQLEQQYQKNRQETRQHIYLTILSITMINNILKLIFDALMSIDSKWFLQLLIVCLCILGLILYKKLKQWIQQCIILINYTCLIEYFQLDNTYTIHQAYFKGLNIMVIHIILLYGTDFKHCIHQIIFSSLSRIVFSFVFKSYLSVAQYFLAFSLICALVAASYSLNLAQRQQFLVKIKENQLKEFIPIVIKQPFYYFEYINYQFQLIRTNGISFSNHHELNEDFCEGCQFRNFLRSFRVNNQSFEQYIIERINNQKQQYSQQALDIVNHKKKMIVQYSELFSDKTQFLIVFNKHTVELQQYLEIQEYYKRFQAFIFNHIKSTYKILRMPKHNLVKNLIRLNLGCTSGLEIVENAVNPFDALKIIRVLKNIVYPNAKIHSLDLELVISTYKTQFILAFYHIFEIFNQINSQSDKIIQLELVPLKSVDSYMLKINIIIEEINEFIQKWKENHVLQRIESILFCEIQQNSIIQLSIQDLGNSIPYQKAYKNKMSLFDIKLIEAAGE